MDRGGVKGGATATATDVTGDFGWAGLGWRG